MEYKESEIIELKRELDDDMKSEIIAFLNSYLGGTIFVGVEDDGSLSNLTEEQLDEIGYEMKQFIQTARNM